MSSGAAMTDPKDLNEAVSLDLVEVVEQLIADGADPHAPGSETIWNGMHPILVGALTNSINAVKILLDKHKVSVRVASKEGDTPVHAAASRGHADLLALLLDGLPADDVNAANQRGYTALHWAAANGFAAVVRQLVAAGAEVDATDVEEGATPLELACLHGQADGAAALLEAGADVGKANKRGFAPLHVVASAKDSEASTALVERLVAAKADVGQKGAAGLAPLHVAALKGSTHAARALLAAGADADSRTAEDASPLQLAVQHDSAAMVAAIAPKADLARADTNGLTPLHWAAATGALNAAAALLDAGANAEATTPDGVTPLHCAAQYKQARMVSLLLQAKPDVNQANSAGMTALHAAAAVGSEDVARALVTAGAAVDAKDSRGRTPLDLAATPAIVRVLRPL